MQSVIRHGFDVIFVFDFSLSVDPQIVEDNVKMKVKIEAVLDETGTTERRPAKMDVTDLLR